MNTAQFEREVWPYRHRLSNFIRPLVNYDTDDSQDVLQETLLAAAKTLHIFRGDSSLYTWLCGIAWHKAMDHRRRMWHRRAEGREKQWRRRREPDNLVHDLGDEEYDEVPANESTVEEFVEYAETQQQIENVLYALPSHYRHVLRLKYLNELNVNEICSLLGDSFKAVESRLTLARKAFRAQYMQQMLSKGA